MANIYFNSGFNVTLISSGLYLAGYRIFNGVTGPFTKEDLTTVGNTWFGYSGADLNTAAFSPLIGLTESINTSTPKTLPTSNQVGSGFTQIGNSDTSVVSTASFVNYAGPLYVLVKIQTRNAGTAFKSINGLENGTASGIIVGDAAATAFYNPTATLSYRGNNNIGKSAFTKWSGNIADLGNSQVAQILYTFDINAQTPDNFNNINSIGLSINI